MTMKSFGRIVPLQGDMLCLAGYGNIAGDGFRDIAYGDTEAAIVKNIREGSKILCKFTGKNFSFSLSDWHEYLLSDEKLKKSYTHPYGWNGVKKAILAEIANPDRARLEALAEEMTSPES